MRLKNVVSRLRNVRLTLQNPETPWNSAPCVGAMALHTAGAGRLSWRRRARWGGRRVECRLRRTRLRWYCRCAYARGNFLKGTKSVSGFMG